LIFIRVSNWILFGKLVVAVNGGGACDTFLASEVRVVRRGYVSDQTLHVLAE
jgi:hypothetical protein